MSWKTLDRIHQKSVDTEENAKRNVTFLFNSSLDKIIDNK